MYQYAHRAPLTHHGPGAQAPPVFRVEGDATQATAVQSVHPVYPAPGVGHEPA